MKKIIVIITLISFNSYSQSETDYLDLIGQNIESIGMFFKMKLPPESNIKMYTKIDDDLVFLGRKVKMVNFKTDLNDIILNYTVKINKPLTRDFYDKLVEKFDKPTDMFITDFPFTKNTAGSSSKLNRINHYCDAITGIHFINTQYIISVSHNFNKVKITFSNNLK